jgi:hypothetical protein
MDECLPFDLLALLFLCFPCPCFPLLLCVGAMLCPLAFRLLNRQKNGVMTSPPGSSHDALLSFFKVSDATKPLLESLPFISASLQRLHPTTSQQNLKISSCSHAGAHQRWDVCQYAHLSWLIDNLFSNRCYFPSEMVVLRNINW